MSSTSPPTAARWTPTGTSRWPTGRTAGCCGWPRAATVAEEIAAPEGLGVFACALGGDDGRTLLLCCAPDFLEHTRAPVREAVLLAVDVAVPHAVLP